MLLGLAFGIQNAYANTSSSHPFILEFGESGLSTPGHFSFPQNLATDEIGNVYVTDLGNKRVQKFNNDGTFLTAWGSSGSGSGQFHSPAGIVEFNGTVTVVDNQLNRIQTFDLDGNFITKWGEEGSEQGQFLLPNGIAVGVNGTIYVVDTGNQRIQKFTPDGEFISEFGESGTEDGKFVTPIDVAIDNQENVYVTDPGKNKIFKYDSEGVFTQSYGPNFAGFALMPQGLETDPNGNIYVTDTTHDRILLISQEGATMSTWGSMGIANGQFKLPKDIALDNNGYLFVVDSNGHRIQKFGSPLTQSITLTESSSNDSESAEENVALPPVNPVPGDFSKPVITPPNDLFIEAIAGLTPVYVGQAMATDESGIQSLSSNAPDQFPLGTTTIIWTAMDGAGNMAIATQVIRVVDTIPPTITALPEITIEAESPDSNPIELEAPLAADAVGVISINHDGPNVFPLGETIVTWTATDVASNTASVLQKVNVVDSTPPTLVIPGDVIFEATSYNQNDIYLGESVVIDNGEIISITNDAPLFFGIGNTTVTWTAADSSGNVASRQQVVSVIDSTAPIISAPVDVIFEAISISDNLVQLGAPLIDDVQNVTVSLDAPLVFPLGETIVTWHAQDPQGNFAIDTQTITVIDTTVPTITIPDDVIVEATGIEGNTISLGNVTAIDVSGILGVTNNAPNDFPFGTTVVTWMVTDNFGNSVTADQTVTVVDTTAPQIRAPDDILLEAMDSESNTVDLDLPWVHDIIAVESYENDAPESFPIGMTTITWSAADTSGNIVSDTQIVTINDTTPPTLDAPSDITVEASSPTGMSISIGDAAVTDLIGVDSVSNNAPDLFYLGNTTITWTATDNFGNSANSTQTITIIDTTAPTITPPSDIVIEAQDSNSNVVAIGVADANDIVGVISVENDSPDVFSLGDNLVTWTATDASGNFATATQKVSIIDSTPPTITAPDAVQVEATSPLDNIIELVDATASDFIGIELITNDAPLVFPVGQTTVTWTATDLGGLSSSNTQIITVVDTTAPTISVPSIITVEANSEDQNVIDFGGIYADDLVGVVSITNNAPEFFPFGLTTITWTVSDEAGNIATGSQKISIVDTTSPEIISPTDIVLEATGQTTSVNLGEPQVSDLVSVSTVTNDAPESFPLGESILTWIVTDTSGNSANSTQTVTIVDTTVPTIETPDDILIEATSSDENVLSLVAPLGSDSVSDVIITNDAPSFLPVGETIITWTITDEEGNFASTNQKVTVVDTTAPELFVPSDITIDAISLQTPIDAGNAAAIDLAESSVTITNDAPFSFPLGETIVTWTAVDSFGNSISSTQTISVQACGKEDSYYNMIMGSAEEDIISGTNVADLIFAEEGDDIIMGAKGNDCIFGGDGDDIIFGNEGADNISGADGNDVIKGQSGDDVIVGGLGIDVIDGGDDIDSCNIDQDPDGDLEIKCES